MTYYLFKNFFYLKIKIEKVLNIKTCKMNSLMKVAKRYCTRLSGNQIKYVVNTEMDFTKIDYRVENPFDDKTGCQILEKLSSMNINDESNYPDIEKMKHVYTSLDERVQGAVHK